jgi:hypothetical protein
MKLLVRVGPGVAWIMHDETAGISFVEIGARQGARQN